MQFIRQDSRIDSKTLTKLLDKYGNVQFKLNSQAISDDIERLKDLAEQKKDKMYVKNCWRIVDYLTKIQRVANKGNIEIKYEHDGKFINSSPIEIRKFADFNIQTTDYIDVVDKSVISLDYSKLMDGLALELGYHDLGYTHEEIEDTLGDIGIVAHYESSKLGKLLEERNYRILYNLRIEDSDYLLPDKKGINDYYGETVKDKISYIEALDSTSRKSMSIIVTEILSEALSNKYEVQLVGVYEDSLVLLVPHDLDAKTIGKQLAKAQVVRIFGRKFAFEPAVQIY